MTTATKKTKTPKRRGGKKNDVSSLPPSADVITISGRDYIIAPLDEFREWEEDRALAALMAERLATDEELIPLEEVERRLDAKKRGRS